MTFVGPLPEPRRVWTATTEFLVTNEPADVLVVATCGRCAVPSPALTDTEALGWWCADHVHTTGHTGRWLYSMAGRLLVGRKSRDDSRPVEPGQQTTRSRKQRRPTRQIAYPDTCRVCADRILRRRAALGRTAVLAATDALHLHVMAHHRPILRGATAGQGARR